MFQFTFLMQFKLVYERKFQLYQLIYLRIYNFELFFLIKNIRYIQNNVDCYNIELLALIQQTYAK